MFALFALGNLAPQENDTLLAPFLDSPLRKERWASTIVLARNKHAHALSALPALLVEELEYCPPSVAAKAPPDDPLLKKAWEQEADWKEATHVRDYHWYLFHRLEIPLLLSSWGDPHALPVLIQAFQRSIDLEFSSTYPNNLHIFAQEWHQFQDRLAYALGQRGAWHALNTLALPPKRRHIAQRYMVFGSLRASVPWIFDYLFLENWGEEGLGIETFLARTGADLTLGLPDLAQVNHVLQEQFALPPREPMPSFHDFLQWHDERDDEWRTRWDTERLPSSMIQQYLL